MSKIRKHATLSVMVGIAAFLLLIAAGASSLTAARANHPAPAPAATSAIGERAATSDPACVDSAAGQSLSNKPCRTCSGKPYCTCTYNGQPRLSCEPCCYRTFNGGEICLD